MLHITNGDYASQRLTAVGIEGGQLAWSDVLHEGPVPAGLSLEEMSSVRASFIVDCGWATAVEAQFHFQTRDAILHSAANTGDVVLWVTHELYDQLHMLQLLSWFATEGIEKERPEIVFINEHLSPDTPEAAIHEAFSKRRQVTEQELLDAVEAWNAFTSSNPRALESVPSEDTQLPYLAEGMSRLKLEYPDEQGISLTERYILETLVTLGEATPYQVFSAVRAKEAIPFMGDASFWRVLKWMIESSTPLITADNQQHFELPGLYNHAENFNERVLSITPAGLSVLEGKSDWLETHMINRWIGGVRLQSPGCWRFTKKTQSFVRN